MPARRGRGEGGLHWDQRRQRWIATASLGFTPAGKRIVKTGSGRTKTEARQKLKEVLRDRDDGLAIAPSGYTVADAVRDWLAYGLADRDAATMKRPKACAQPPRARRWEPAGSESSAPTTWIAGWRTSRAP